MKAEICQERFSECFCRSFIAAEVQIECLANDSVVRYIPIGKKRVYYGFFHLEKEYIMLAL